MAKSYTLGEMYEQDYFFAKLRGFDKNVVKQEIDNLRRDPFYRFSSPTNSEFREELLRRLKYRSQANQVLGYPMESTPKVTGAWKDNPNLLLLLN